MQKKKVVCHGAGVCLELMLQHFDYDKMEFVAILDQSASHDSQYNHPLLPYPVSVIKPDAIAGLEYDYVIICSFFSSADMLKDLLTLGVSGEKCLFAEPMDILRKNDEKLNSMFSSQSLFLRFTVKDTIEGTPKLLSNFTAKAANDYVRVAALDLLAKQIKNRNITGDMAEVGVWRGYFSALFNELFPERRLYLFDTFEGFANEDLQKDGLPDDWSAHKWFSDTSAEIVLSNMPHPEKCVIRKGYFPETVAGLSDDIRFALVNLDADVYDPIYAGLNWFYPRMTKGGCILIHDYENGGCPGVRKAVDQFCSEHGLYVVPLPDYAGTVILVKY